MRLRTCERYERLMMVLVLACLFLMANTVRHGTLSWFTVGRACIRDYLPSLAACVRFLRPALLQL